MLRLFDCICLERFVVVLRFTSTPDFGRFCPMTLGKTSLNFAHAKDGFTHGLKDTSFSATDTASRERKGSEDLKISCPP